MVSITYREADAPAGENKCGDFAQPVRPARKKILRVIFETIMEAQQMHADMEIRRYRHLLPREYEWAGDQLNENGESSLPFIRKD